MQDFINFIHSKVKDDISKEDLIWFLNRLEKSKTTDSIWTSLLLKLKLEFGDQLSQEKAKVEQDRRRVEELRRQEKEKRKTQKERFKRRIRLLAAQDREMQDKFNELSDFIKHNYVRDREHIPDHLLDIYDLCETQKLIIKPWLSRYRISHKFSNPYAKQIEFEYHQYQWIN